MSILPLPLTGGVLLHSLPFEAYDTTGTHNGGVWQRDPGDTYKVTGSIQPAGDKDLKILPEGERSEGAIILRVFQPMYMEDVTQSGAENRQTFILWNNETYRVRKLAHWSPHSGVYKYVAVKFLDRKETSPVEY